MITRYIDLKETDQQELADLYKNSRYHVERQRIQCVLLSHSGNSIKELREVFGVSRFTITKWLDRWQAGARQVFCFGKTGAASTSWLVWSGKNWKATYKVTAET